MTLLEVSKLSKTFPIGKSVIGRPKTRLQAVKAVSFSLERGETLAIAGESGSGKSTLARMVMGLIKADSGSVKYGGTDIGGFDRGQKQRFRREVQMIFQDPYASFDPRMVIADQVAEPLKVHKLVSGRDARRARVTELLGRVGLGAHQLERFPYELSGGQLQRAAIARSLASEPTLIVCDEPVAALDMSIRAQIINLLRNLQNDSAISLLFISHDLSLLRVISHRVAVMYGGEIVEIGSAAQVFSQPAHSYTRTLLSAVLPADPRQGRHRTAWRMSDGAEESHRHSS